MQANATRRLAPVLRQMQDLDRKDRKDAGHEVEDDACDQRGDHGTGLIGTEHPWFADLLFWLKQQGFFTAGKNRG